MTEFFNVAKKSEVAQGKGKLCQVQGKPVALFCIGGTFFAIDNTCPHRGGPLSEGSLDGFAAVCPWHGFRFDVRTGMNADGMPHQVRRYEVKVDGENVQIGV